jgi:subtilase family serine protease
MGRLEDPLRPVRRTIWSTALLTAPATLLLAASVGAASSGPPATHEFAALAGHVSRFAQSRFDLGEAPSSLGMHGLELIVAKTTTQAGALNQLLADQQNPKSPRYHRWLTPAEYGARFGASDAALSALANWLESQGLQVGRVPAGRGHLPFSGTKAQVEAAFHTQIHRFDVSGEQHYANVSNPSVPATLQPLLVAVRGLDDFHPKAGAKRAARPDTFYSGSNQYPGYVGPSDFATMYDLTPLYAESVTGVGVTVAIAAQSDVDASILTTFWSSFGVSGTSFGLQAQSFSSIAVPIADGGSDPGQTRDGNEDEAYLDTEIVGGLAPGATIVLVRDQDASVAAQYVIDQNLAAVLNVSFGVCESGSGASNAFTNSTWQQAVAEGITVTVSTGDAGVATCTAEADIGKANDVNTGGFAVNGLASTPYDLAVGGTDFNPNTESQYWNTSNHSGSLVSAISHIPEMVWNGSCANPIFADYYGVSDPIEFCNTNDLPGVTPTTANPFIVISGGGGGLSSCTTTDIGGNCTGGYAEPSWQSGSLGARALPDVSMIATRWLVCSYDTSPCDPTQAPTFPPAATGTIKVLQGTSAAAPAVAAIIALLDQTQITPTSTDGRQGLINPLLYQLAAAEYPASATQCDASQGAITSSLCVFYDVTAGSNAQPCSVAHYAANAAGTSPASTCGSESGDTTGIMEVTGTQSYAAGPGFDIATGLGSINAAALVAAVQGAASPRNLRASASAQTVTLTWSTVANATGYDVYQGSGTGPVSSTPVRSNVAGTTAAINGLQFGQHYVFAVAAVSSSGVSPMSAPVSLMTVPAAPAAVKVTAGASGVLNVTWTGSSGASAYQLYEATTSKGEGATPTMTGLTGTTVSISNLNTGAQYFFTVTAVDAGGASAPSAQASGTVIPGVPTSLSATAGNASVSLSWSAAAGATSYNVYRGTAAGGEGSTPVSTGITGTGATVSGLSNGQRYYFYVTGVDAGGSSAASNEANAEPIAPSGGGGGSMDGFLIGALTFLIVARGGGSRRLE